MNPSQLLLVYLAEAVTPRDGGAIAAAAVPTPGFDTALLGVAPGSLCVVLVARSIVKGKPSTEDMHSTERFRAPLVAALTGA